MLRRLPDSGACHKHSSGFQAFDVAILEAPAGDWPEARGSAQAGSRHSTLPSSKRTGGRLAGGSRKRSGGFQAFDVAILEADRRETGRRLAGALKRLPGIRRSHPRSGPAGDWPKARGSAQAASRFRRMSQALKRVPGVRRGHPRSAGGRLAGGSRKRSGGFQAFDVAILEADRRETGRRLAEALRRVPGVRRSHPRSGSAGDWPKARGSAQAASRHST